MSRLKSQPEGVGRIFLNLKVHSTSSCYDYTEGVLQIITSLRYFVLTYPPNMS